MEFEAIEIGGRIIQLSVKTAEKVRVRRKFLARKNARITKELIKTNLLPNKNGTGNKHAYTITESYTIRKRDKTTSETRQAIINGQNIARKNNFENEWQKMKVSAFKI